MTIEEKAKRYDEALEMARDSFTYPDYPGFIRADVVFPELKESEDERIRKELIDAIQGLWDNDALPLPLTTKRKNEWLDWLERQGEQKDFIVDFKAKDWYVSKVDGKIHNIYHSDKVEQKFKIGDWICNGGGNPCKVNDIFGNYYELCSIEDYKYNKPISDVDANYHLWTIDDAKDHDILTVDGRPFIYCCNDNYKGNYCCIDSDGKFRPNLDFGFNGKTILPATKEQRDLILQMSENTPLNY